MRIDAFEGDLRPNRAGSNWPSCVVFSGREKKPHLGSFAVCPQQKIGGNYFLGMSLTYLIQINKSVANASEKLIFTSCEAITFLTCF